MVFRFGEPCESFHAMVTGRIEPFAFSPVGHEKVIKIVSPGQSFTEALMFSGRACILRARALADSLVASIGKEAVLGEDGSRRSAFTVSLPVSKATIAPRLSLTPEYFSRVLHEL